MEEKAVIESLLDYMNENGVAFASDIDNVFDKSIKFYELDEYGEPTEKARNKIFKEIESFIGNGAADVANAIEVWYWNALNEGTIIWKENIVARYKIKPVEGLEDLHEVDIAEITRAEHKEADANMETYQVSRKGLVHESKNILREANKQSSQIILDKKSAEDFDAESEDGKIVIRTEKMFYELSDKNFDVQVSFDNGESTNKISLDDPSITVLVTISDSTSKLDAYVSGNFQLTDNTLSDLSKIRDIVDNTLAE